MINSLISKLSINSSFPTDQFHLLSGWIKQNESEISDKKIYIKLPTSIKNSDFKSDWSKDVLDTFSNCNPKSIVVQEFNEIHSEKKLCSVESSSINSGEAENRNKIKPMYMPLAFVEADLRIIISNNYLYSHHGIKTYLGVGFELAMLSSMVPSLPKNYSENLYANIIINHYAQYVTNVLSLFNDYLIFGVYNCDELVKVDEHKDQFNSNKLDRSILLSEDIVKSDLLLQNYFKSSRITRLSEKDLL